MNEEKRSKGWGVWIIVWLAALVGCGPTEPSPTSSSPTHTVTATPRIGVDFVTKPAPTVAIRQLTPSPASSPTPIPSPTPIVYTVIGGDTLTGIARQSGHTVDEILALNPDISPDLLRIGQQLVLPPPGTPQPGAVNTAVPASLTVRQVQTYHTPADRVWLLGVVENTDLVAAENIQVSLTLPAADGAEEETAVVWVALPLLPPGKQAPFAALLPVPAETVGAPAVMVSGELVVGDLGNRYLDLIVGETAISSQETTTRVTGRVTNTGTAVAERVLLVVTLYDKDDRISGYQQQWLADPLPPGESAPFSLPITVPGSQAVRADVVAQALIVNAEETTSAESAAE